MIKGLFIQIKGTVQGVGFRPFVFHLAHAHDLKGWVLNAGEGVEIWLEGKESKFKLFLKELKVNPPPAATITSLKVERVLPKGILDFTIRHSEQPGQITVQISPDLAVCDACLKEMRDPNNRRYQYPYINCTDCGPRYSIITALPYDRPHTTMKKWGLCKACQVEYNDSQDRRFHAQPVACYRCGPSYFLKENDVVTKGSTTIARAAKLLSIGKIVAIKGLGGYHLACDVLNPKSVKDLRERKFRKAKAFAVMVRDLETASSLVHLTKELREVLNSSARPIVLAKSKRFLEGIAPNNNNLGIMLAYTPLHHLLFDAGAPNILVLTSANRSSEPIAYQDDEAISQLKDIADAFLIGERPIARRIDDSVVKASTLGITIIRRARSYAPSAVANFPNKDPILAVGADLKNSISLVVDGQAFVSQHIGDLEHYGAFKAFQETINDLTSMYGVELKDAIIACDAHPNYQSTQYALGLLAKKHVPVQHHRAHIASVLAERQTWNTKVLGMAFDGAGYGDDGTIWGGEFFVGSLQTDFERVGHLLCAKLVGGDAAAKHPVQAAAGFLTCLEDLPDLTAAPFNFGERYFRVLELLEKNLQVFPTTSVGRLFDTVAALLGFTREISFEGQAAVWLEHLATKKNSNTYPLPFKDGLLDFRPLLSAIIQARLNGVDRGEITFSFHQSFAKGLLAAITHLSEKHKLKIVVLSGGVFQNSLLLELLYKDLIKTDFTCLINQKVPSNDGGISLGQAALCCNKLYAGNPVDDLE